MTNLAQHNIIHALKKKKHNKIQQPHQQEHSICKMKGEKREFENRRKKFVRVTGCQVEGTACPEKRAEHVGGSP